MSSNFFSNADAYENFMGRYSRVLAPEFARAAGVEAGQRVLDVGCGPGALTTVLAGMVGADHVAAVDPTEPFVEQCRVNVPGADVRLAPAEALPFEDASFDRTLAQLVFHFVSDPIASVGEMKRVTRPGGKVAACVWDMTGGMTMIRAYWEAAREADPEVPSETERFGGKPAQLADLWRAAGLQDVEETSLRVSTRYQDFDELWQSFRRGEGPIGVHAASLEGEKHDAVRDALFRRIGSPDGPFELTASAWCAVGTV
jgi:ubiquinone/menaquinone biosynthesis C-methylase UbiE